MFVFQVLYEYVFSNSYITGPFGIFSSFPRAFIGLEQMVGDIEGLRTVEEGEDLIAPLSLREMVRNLIFYTSDCLVLSVAIFSPLPCNDACMYAL